MSTDHLPLKSAREVRRVITGLDDSGKSCVLLDGPTPWADGDQTVAISEIWASAVIPVDNSGTEDRGSAVLERSKLGGTGFGIRVAEIAPGHGATNPGLHFNNTLDLMVVLAGEVVSVLETGEVVLRTGDTMTIRGHVHGWRNDGDVPAVLIMVNVPAHQVSEGKSLY